MGKAKEGRTSQAVLLEPQRSRVKADGTGGNALSANASSSAADLRLFRACGSIIRMGVQISSIYPEHDNRFWFFFRDLYSGEHA
jgi:hypothetical protein